MPTRTLTMLGAQSEVVQKGSLNVLSSAKTNTAFPSDEHGGIITPYIDVDNGGGPIWYGTTLVALYDKNNNLVKKIINTIDNFGPAPNLQLVLIVNDVLPVAGLDSENNFSFSYRVDPATFSTGKVVLAISGKLGDPTSPAASISMPGAIIVRATGQGHLQVTCPFTVVDT